VIKLVFSEARTSKAAKEETGKYVKINNRLLEIIESVLNLLFPHHEIWVNIIIITFPCSGCMFATVSHQIAPSSILKFLNQKYVQKSLLTD
jgi:hypothetical protein